MNIKIIELCGIFWTGDDSTEYFNSNEVQICLFVFYHFESNFYQWHIFFLNICMIWHISFQLRSLSSSKCVSIGPSIPFIYTLRVIFNQKPHLNNFCRFCSCILPQTIWFICLFKSLHNFASPKAATNNFKSDAIGVVRFSNFPRDSIQ